MWGVRCALDTGVARTLGLTSDELESRLQRRSLAQIAAERGVPMARVRRVARAIAEPQLAAAVAAGVIKDAERTALFRRLESRTGPWSDLAPAPRARARHHARRSSALLSSSSSSSRRAQVLGGSEAGKVSSSSSSSFASSSSRGGVESAVTRTSHRTS
jgi:crotonobetainyl-CoA:carnitine CoA-transferase CaiB-like acyl-CoA transferase